MITIDQIEEIVIDGIETNDYPDFSNAYIDSGTDVDGNELTEDQLDYIEETYPDYVYECTYEQALGI